MEMLVGPGGEALVIDLPFDGMLAAALPPGAFFGLAVLLALRNVYIDRARARARSRQRAARRSGAA
jgi:Na+-translocating ferredoxin:NAD+ oxidoreductase RnfE subunit